MRSNLPGEALWFATLCPETGDLAGDDARPGRYRDVRARKDLERWLRCVELPYYSPHKFRHGHAVYSIKNAKNVGDLKAISQNLMHSNLSITDGVYGILSEDDQRERILGLGGNNGRNSEFSNDQLKKLLELAAARL